MSAPSRVQRTVRAAALWASAAMPAIIVGQAGAAELLISSQVAHKVLEFDAGTGAYVGVFADNTSGLSGPRAILLGSDGNVYVASYGTDSVKKYSATGTYLGDFVTAGSGGLDGPDGMCWGPDGNLYVSSNLNHRVLRYQGPGGASPGAFIDTFVTAGSGGLSGPRGLVFGNDQYTGGAPGPAQDGYPELLVCSWNSEQILRYNGQTNPSLAAGAFVDVYGQLPGGSKPNDLIYERLYEDSSRYDTLLLGNLLVSMDGSNIVGIFSGALSRQEHINLFGFPNYYEGFFGTGLSSPRGLAWGPDRGTAGTVGNYDGYQDLYIANYVLDNIPVAGSDESNLGVFITGGPAPSPGPDGPSYMLFKCGDRPATLIRKVLQNNGLLGTTMTVRLQGDNLAALTGASLRKMRQWGGIGADGTYTIAGQNLRMDGNDVLVDFPLTAPGVECGRYRVVPADSCAIAGWFPDVVLVYAPGLQNTGFEEGWVADRETLNICDNPGANGNKSRPRHWDIKRVGWQNQLDLKRDGNVWHPCSGGTAKGATDLRYGSIMSNISSNDQIIVYQTIAAPDVSTRPYRVYVDARIASFQQLSYGYIRLVDGVDKVGAVIAETQIPNTQALDPDGIVRNAAFTASVPQGYVWQSSPPLLTVMFVLQNVVGDEEPGWGALKAFHLDNVRNSFQVCPNSPWADADGDGDVDSDDFAAVQRCLTVGNNDPMDPTCQCFDRNGDNEIDVENDLVQFVLCGTGPGATTVLPGCE